MDKGKSPMIQVVLNPLQQKNKLDTTPTPTNVNKTSTEVSKTGLVQSVQSPWKNALSIPVTCKEPGKKEIPYLILIIQGSVASFRKGWALGR